MTIEAGTKYVAVSRDFIEKLYSMDLELDEIRAFLWFFYAMGMSGRIVASNKFLSKKFNISEERAEKIVSKLVRLGLIEKDDENQLEAYEISDLVGFELSTPEDACWGIVI